MITGYVADNMGLPIRARHCGGYFPVGSTGTLCGLMGCTIPGAFVFKMQLALYKKMAFEPVRVKETASLTNCTSLDMPLCEKNPHGSTVP